MVSKTFETEQAEVRDQGVDGGQGARLGKIQYPNGLQTMHAG